MNDAHERLKATRGRIRAFGKHADGVMSAFAAVSKAAMKSGEFDAGQRELIAVALSVLPHCDDCIPYHVDAASRVEMGGGPARVCRARLSNMAVAGR